MRHRLVSVFGLVLLVVATSCTKPIQPTVVYPGLPFTITPTRSVEITGSLTLTFNRVTSDSRCPTDVVCITAGDAVVSVSLADSASRVERELHTVGDLSQAKFSSYTIRLVELTPYPRSTRAIDPRDYTATLQITSP